MEMFWGLLLFVLMITLFYQRASLIVWGASIIAYAVVWAFFAGPGIFSLTLFCAIFALIWVPLAVKPWRYKLLSLPILKLYRELMPTMSRTEREALSAGTVGFEGDLFRGNPDWKKLFAVPKATLTDEEKAFLEGPVSTLCSMIDDWDITHNRADLPPEMWAFLKENGFFGLIIPKEFGGKGFSAFAHSEVLIKIYGKSISVATTVSVPNSLGPAELLLHYGTKEQQDYYLPRLAKGLEMPCFALTGPEAGSDASAMTDKGIVCWGEHAGKKVLGLRLHFDKRYITLAPVATIIGLAFKMYDPDHLIGDKIDLGITCALIPRGTPGITIGRRHFPVNVVFQNGPIQGKDVFIPLDWIIGGPSMAGKGWKMLMECLAAGRAISLPSSSLGGAKALGFATGAYARIRRQFNVPIGRFEGIEEVLGRIGGRLYQMDASRQFTCSIIDLGEKPAVASAIVKYHVTELGRALACDIMDVHGGKGICLGPNNYLGRFYESCVIGITVEGANILTRNMIIFGQGVMRCHPYMLKELEAARLKDEKERLATFDQAIIGHISFFISNVFRSFILALTSSRLVVAPQGKMKRYLQHATRFSSAFALLTDISALVFGGALKRKESISARLGDILSYLYILSSVLKRFKDQGEQVEDLPLMEWAVEDCLYQIQERFFDIFGNFPNRWLSGLLAWLIFPWGKRFKKPSDRLTHKIAKMMQSTSPSRYRLAEGAYLALVPGNSVAWVEDALVKVIAIEPIEKVIKAKVQTNEVEGDTLLEQAKMALDKSFITQQEWEKIMEAEEARKRVIAVDDFSSEELMHGVYALKEFNKTSEIK